jgi:enoyl-CoA hydratase/carnithine racemase
MELRHLNLSLADGIAHLTLNRPERRNAPSLELLKELLIVLDGLWHDPEARVIVISGEGAVFSSGHDLGEMIDRDEVFYDELFTTCTDVMLRLQALPQPVIAQVHGTATAAGCQLVAACDLAVASQDARFATPGVHIGLFCSTPMVPLTRAVGRKRAMQMLLTGDFVDSATALDWGLVNYVVARDELGARTDALARQIMRFSPVVIGIGKRAFYAQVDAKEAEAYRSACTVMSGNAQHDDAQEGMTAFLEKRKPQWPIRRA